MKKSKVFNFRSALLVLTAVVLSVGDSHAKSINIPLNRAEVIRTNEVLGTVVVGNPNVADVNVHGETSFSVIAKSIGSTSIRLTDQKGNVIDKVEVTVSYDLPAVRKAINNFFPDANVTVRPIGTSIAISGFVQDAETAGQIQKIVFEFVKENVEQLQEFEEIVESDDKYPGIVNLMRVTTGHQVMLKVRMGEIQRTAIKEIGVNLQAVTDVGSSVFRFGTNSLVSGGASLLGNVLQGGTGFGSAGGFVQRGSTGFGGVLDLLENEGLFKVLAEPNIVAMSGEEARFLAGGQFAFPSEATDGVVAYEFQDFGVGVNFVPWVINPNRIRLSVSPSLSEIDFDNSSTIPTLTTRTVDTTVELAPGETFMIAGLIKDQLNASISEVPGLSELPIISSLFRSSKYQRNETELVIAITPYLVDPLVGNELKLPTDDYRTPSVMEMFFYGALGSTNKKDDTYSQTPSFEGPVGYMID